MTSRSPSDSRALLISESCLWRGTFRELLAETIAIVDMVEPPQGMDLLMGERVPRYDVVFCALRMRWVRTCSP